MDLMLSTILILILLGLITGTVVSLVGASGVMLIVPVLTLVFSIPIHMAIGTSLLVDMIASVVVSSTYFREGNTDLRSGLWLALGTIIGAQLGVLVAQGLSETVMGGAFGVGTALLGLMMLLRKPHQFDEPQNSSNRFSALTARARTGISVLIGVGIGVMSGLIGASGGLIILLILVFLLEFPIHLAVGTSTLIMAITALSASIGYGLNGGLDLIVALIIVIGSITGGYFGSKFANRVSEDVLSKIIGIVFIIIGIVMYLLPS